MTAELDNQTILAAEGLSKSFPPVRALDGVSLAFAKGQAHGIVGENGAGKSTLMKVFSGLCRPSSGRVFFKGVPVTLAGPAQAIALGISMVHQELNLIDELTVADNIFLGREDTWLGLIRQRRTLDQARQWLGRVGAEIDPAAKVKTLSIAQRQMVEIAKAVSCNASVIILDEPTAVLTQKETAVLFDLIARMKEQGVTVLYISHILPEVLRLCDRITVMRDGRVVRTVVRGELGQGHEAEMALSRLMVGREMGDHFGPRGLPQHQTVLAVQKLSAPPQVNEVSFEVRRGEILGFAGLIGAGRTELAEAIMALRPRRGGTVLLEGNPIVPRGVRHAVDAGMAYLSEDRRGRGLILGRSIIENTTVVSLRRYVRGGLISPRAELAATQEHVRRLGAKVGRCQDAVDNLSGGNQQKVALARWLEVNPRLLILDEPTRGVDIGAKEEIYRLIRELAAQGMACMLISSELNELLGLCHRIAVMRGGRIVATLEGSAMTEENVMNHAAGVKGAMCP